MQSKIARLIMAFAAGLMCAVSLNSHAAARPNIIFILADDLGYGDMGVFFQNHLREVNDPSAPWHFTPNLDRFAAEGMKLPQYYCAAPVCAPSRASILSGQHQGHANVRDNQFDKALEDNYTLGTVMKKAGYATAAIGKWGLQGKPKTSPPDWPAHPLNRGFDFYFGYIRHSDGHEHYPKEGVYEKPKEVWDNRREVSSEMDKCYTADLFTARAKKWIVDQKAQKPGQPFFIYLAYDTPHAVLELPTEAYPAGGGLTGGVQWLGTPGRMINTAEGTVDSYYHPDYANATWKPKDNATVAPWPDVYKRFACSVRRVDDCVADVLQLLKDLKIDDNTLVIFTSDNGPSRESYLKERYEADFFHSFGPFDGIKRDCWEGGMRVGALARWPGVIRAGGESGLPCAAWDWMPTFAELGGLPAPARTDGRSLAPTLTGKGRQLEPLIYVEYFEGGKTPDYPTFAPAHRGRLRRDMQALRMGDFMGVRYNIKSAEDDFEIYDIIKDPQETRDLARSKPGMERAMKETVLQVRRPGGGTKRPYDEALVPAARVDGLRTNELHYSVYEGNWPWVPDFDMLSAVKTGSAAGLDLGVAGKGGDFGIEFTGYFLAPTGGDYTFYMKSDSGSELRLHRAIVIDDDFHHDGSEASASIKLKAGRHPIEVSYRHGKGEKKLSLEYSGPGIERQPVTASSFSAPEGK